MPIGPVVWSNGRSLRLSALFLTVAAALVVSRCGQVDPPMRPTTPTSTATAASPSGTGTASPDLTASPSGSGTPGSVTPSGTGSSGSSVVPLSCSSGSVTPVRIERSTVEPRRTTEVVTLVSDGRNLTPGTREQTDFADPVLTAPDGSTVTEEAILAKIADLIEKSSKNTVLLERPEAPDTGADANKRPFNATGTYVLYNASGLIRADVIVQCSTDQSAGTAGGQEQRWLFTAEADNTVGTINCAVEPPKGNAVARQVYGTFC